jgi:hypothetical protein
LRLDRLELFDFTEMAISQGLIGQRPQTFRRLQLGRVRGQKVQMDSCRRLHLRADMPARTVEHEEDLFTGIVKLTAERKAQGFVVRPWCWIVERTLAWRGSTITGG